MEFIERVDYRSVQWLMSQLSNDFIAKYTNINEGNGYKYSLISQVLKEFNKNDGVRKAVYHKGSTDTHKILLILSGSHKQKKVVCHRWPERKRCAPGTVGRRQCRCASGGSTRRYLYLVHQQEAASGPRRKVHSRRRP